jgi:RNA polymerase sigma factor (sigma-70 family)
MTRPAVDLKLKSLADKLLIELTLAGRQECFSALMDRHMDCVRRRINGLIRNTSDAEDVAQEVRLKVWMNLSSFRFDSSFRTWMVRIAINESLQWRRRAKRRRQWDAEELDGLTASTESAFQAYARKEAANAIRRAQAGARRVAIAFKTGPFCSEGLGDRRERLRGAESEKQKSADASAH